MTPITDAQNGMGGEHPTTPKTSDDMTAAEIAVHIEQWFKDRANDINNGYGFEGRDLRRQDDLISSVIRAEKDITQLLRYCLDITRLLSAGVGSQPTHNKKAKS